MSSRPPVVMRAGHRELLGPVLRACGFVLRQLPRPCCRRRRPRSRPGTGRRSRWFACGFRATTPVDEVRMQPANVNAEGFRPMDPRVGVMTCEIRCLRSIFQDLNEILLGLRSHPGRCGPVVGGDEKSARGGRPRSARARSFRPGLVERTASGQEPCPWRAMRSPWWGFAAEVRREPDDVPLLRAVVTGTEDDVLRVGRQAGALRRRGRRDTSRQATPAIGSR